MEKLMKKLFTLLLLVVVSANIVGASAVTPNSTPETIFVTKVADEIMASIKKGGGEKAISVALQKTFTNYVDLPWVANFVLGRHARTLNAEEKLSFVNSYKDFMVESYATRLKNYAGETYKIGKQQDLGNGKTQVRMEIYRKEGAPIFIDYKIHKVQEGHKADDKFKIYDMAVEGISLITTQRSEFDAVIERKGFASLIASLEKNR
jgi:phospholipid transport system substrate-binding protein